VLVGRDERDIAQLVLDVDSQGFDAVAQGVGRGDAGDVRQETLEDALVHGFVGVVLLVGALLVVHLLLGVVVPPLVLLENLLLLLGRLLVRGFGSQGVAHLNLLLQVVVVLPCGFRLVVCLLGGLGARHHAGHSLGPASIDQRALRADGGGCAYLGLRAGRLLHTWLEIVHVTR